MIDKPRPLFRLGQIVATPAAIDAIQGVPRDLLDRHVCGDWGDVDDEDAHANALAVETGDRILSAYLVNGVKVLVITEGDRAVTTILLPEEY